MMKYQIKGWLEQFDVYYQVRYSDLYFFFQKALKPSLASALRQEYELYREALTSQQVNGLIFDIGASEGYTAKSLLRLGSRLVCVEPAVKNIRALKARFSSNPKVEIVSCALGAKKGTAQLYLADRGATLHTLSQEWKQVLEEGNTNRFAEPMHFQQRQQVDITTLDELIRLYGRPDFIKIDVEGYESAVLRGLSQRIPLISFEANLPECRADVLECVRLLLELDPNALFNYSYRERLEWAGFVGGEQLVELINQEGLRYLEVFCGMRV